MSPVKSRWGPVSPSAQGPVAPGWTLWGKRRSVAAQCSRGILGKALGFPFVRYFFFCLVPSCLDPLDHGIWEVSHPN